MSRLRVLSLFSGAGGLDLPFMTDDRFEIVGTSEIDKHACAVLRYHNPRIKNYGDITQISKRKLPDCDIIIGGSPCQSFSIAGKREGLKGESGLFYHFIQAVKEKNPSYFIWENVKGTLSSSSGWDFANVQVAMAEAGYDIEWEIFNAKEFGVPQNRERIFILGSRREGSGRKVLPKRRSGSENPKRKSLNFKNREIKAVGNVYEKPHSTGRIYPTDGICPSLRSQQGCVGAPIIVTRSHKKLKKQDHVNCIDANYHKGMDNRGQRSLVAYSKSTRETHIDHRVRINESANTLNTGDGCRTQSSANYIWDDLRLRKITPLEGERLMTWPDNFTKFGRDEDGNIYEISDTQRYRMIGNGVVSECVKSLKEKLI